MNPILQKAIQFHQSGNFQQAEHEYKALLATGQTDPMIFNYLSDAMNRQGKLQETVQMLQKATAQHPGDVYLKITLGQTLLGLGQLKDARSLAETMERDYPEKGEVHYFTGNLYMQENRLEEAFTSFQKAVKQVPQLAEAHYNMGLIAYQKGDGEAARKHWQACLKQQQAFIPALLNLGNLEMDLNFHEKALQHLDKALHYDPNNSYAHKLSGMAKHYLGDKDAALSHYKKVLETEGSGDEILTLLGNVNRDMNRMENAVDYYEKALALNPQNTLARENLDKISSSRIEGWHFDMLGDLARNQGYQEAIERAVKGGETVLDIGTGSGLLSMMCARAGAKKVYTCETIQLIADTAATVISDNGYRDQIHVIHKQSNSLKVGEDLPKKADILISEVLDSGLLGEGVLPTVRHATANLLKEGGTIVPAGATVKGVLIQSDHLHSIAPLKDISGFDLSSFGKFQTKNVYRRETLNNVPYKVLSAEFRILDIDFYHLPKAAGENSPNLHQLEIEITADGELHAVAFWFDLHLDDQLSLSSGPEGEMIHWGQAVYSLNPPKSVKAGDKISLTAAQSEMKIVFSS